MIKKENCDTMTLAEVNGKLNSLTRALNYYTELSASLVITGNTLISDLQFLGGSLFLSGSPSTPFTLNLPITTELTRRASVDLPLDGTYQYRLTIVNSSTQLATLVVGDAGTVIEGSAAIDPGIVREYLVTLVSGLAVNIKNLGFKRADTSVRVQTPNLVATGGSINSTPVGATTPSTGAFTTLSTTGNTTVGDTSGDQLTVNATTLVSAPFTANSSVTLNDNVVVGSADTDALSVNATTVFQAQVTAVGDVALGTNGTNTVNVRGNLQASGSSGQVGHALRSGGPGVAPYWAATPDDQVAVTAPATRSNGQPLQEGDRYWDSASNKLYVRDAALSAWVEIAGGGGGGTTYVGGTAVSSWGTRIATLGSTFPNSPSSIFLGGTFLENGTDTGTEHSAIEVGEFEAIQLIYQNASTTTPMIISGARILAAADYADKVQDAAFTASSIPVTFNGGSLTATIPPGVQSNILFSDPIPIASVPRTDIIGRLPALFSRTCFAFPQGANSLISSWNPTGTDWTDGSRLWFQAGAYGNKLTTALGRTPTATGRRVLVGIRYLSPYKVMTIAVTGTSLTNNNTNTLARQPGGWHHRAAVALSTPTRPVEICNFGFSTQTSTQYRANFERLCQQVSATHYLIEGASVNDMSVGESAWTQPAIDTNLRNIVACLDLAQRLWRARVGLWNGYPRSTNGNGGVSALTINSDTRRLGYLAKLATIGYDYVNTNAVVADNQSPQSWQTVLRGYPADLTDDGIHPNEAGDLALTTGAFQPLFARWANDYFAL